MARRAVVVERIDPRVSAATRMGATNPPESTSHGNPPSISPANTAARAPTRATPRTMLALPTMVASQGPATVRVKNAVARTPVGVPPVAVPCDGLRRRGATSGEPDDGCNGNARNQGSKEERHWNDSDLLPGRRQHREVISARILPNKQRHLRDKHEGGKTQGEHPRPATYAARERGIRSVGHARSTAASLGPGHTPRARPSPPPPAARAPSRLGVSG